ncbi:hypothetical protein AB6E04_09610 [Vibrio amylolyticus]|uniref:hypothetical protein n=1 Tax=Vibrio amylolyticus TaxID=2847292 RepID=UPI003550AF6C
MCHKRGAMCVRYDNVCSLGELSGFSRLGGSAGHWYVEVFYANDEAMTIAGDIFLNQATQLKDRLYPK